MLLGAGGAGWRISQHANFVFFDENGAEFPKIPYL